MQDEQLKKLTNAYIEKEIDFNEYRILRTEYIDSITGYESQPDQPATNNTPTDDTSDNDNDKELSPLIQLALSTAFIVTLFFALMFFLKTPVGK